MHAMLLVGQAAHIFNFSLWPRLVQPHSCQLILYYILEGPHIALYQVRRPVGAAHGTCLSLALFTLSRVHSLISTQSDGEKISYGRTSFSPQAQGATVLRLCFVLPIPCSEAQGYNGLCQPLGIMEAELCVPIKGKGRRLAYCAI